MKILIFLAGAGSRIKSLTTDPKCLLKIGDKPILYHYFDMLNTLNIPEVYIVVGYKQEMIREAVEKYIQTHPKINVNFIVDPSYDKNSISSLIYSKHIFDDDVITLDGDMIFDKEILRKLIDEEGKNFYVVDSEFDQAPSPHRFITVTDNNGFIKTLNYEDKIPEQQKQGKIYESVGIVKWSKTDSEIFKKAFEEMLEKGLLGDVYQSAIRYLIKNNLAKFKVLQVSGLKWQDVDIPEDIELAEKTYFELKRSEKIE